MTATIQELKSKQSSLKKRFIYYKKRLKPFKFLKFK